MSVFRHDCEITGIWIEGTAHCVICDLDLVGCPPDVKPTPPHGWVFCRGCDQIVACCPTPIVEDIIEQVGSELAPA